MAQNNIDFSDNPTGAGLMDDYLDKEQQNVLTSNSGIQRPSYAVAGTKWLDTSANPWVWKMYDGTNDVSLGTIDPSTHLFTPTGVLPSQDGNSGKFLQTDGSKTVWTNAVDYTNITNCITEIPQDIKLELKDGTLTLKAGSKVYVPNGEGRFDVVNITSNRTTASNTLTGKYFVFAASSNLIIDGIYIRSGSTFPSSAISGDKFYNTTENKIYRYSGSEWQPNGYSLPLAIITLSSGSVTSIDQVFNGFGYIGSTVFALPGVKGLIPNGRNTDGSLKNIEFTISKVVTQTPTTSFTDMPFVVNASNIQWIDFLGEFLIPPAVQQYKGYFNPIENKMYFAYTTDSWTQIGEAFCGRVSSNGKITSLAPKTTFHAVDYNDFKTAIDAKGGLPVGSVLYTLRTDVPEGGAWCDGALYTKAQFPDVYQMLVDGKLQSTTVTDFDSKVSANGSCGFFGLDTANERFKVPMLKDVYLKAGQAPSMFGAESLPNIKGAFYGERVALTAGPNSGVFYEGNNPYGGYGTSPYSYNNLMNFNASRSSSTYQDGAKVNPDHVTYRAYVVLYASAAEASVAQAAEFMTALGGKADVALDNVSTAGKSTAVGWGMPDYTTGITVSLTGITSFTAPYDCEVYYNSRLQNGAIENLYINGVLVAVMYASSLTGSTTYLKMSKGDILSGLSPNDNNRNSSFIYYKLKGVN